MNNKTDIHPDSVLESLLAKTVRANKRTTLMKLHELCRGQYASNSSDFSVSTIGRLAEVGGLITYHALYNAGAKDHRTLIEAWQAYSGPAAPKPAKVLASDDYLRRIEDPAIRSIVQAAFVERDKLRAQLNTLKSNSSVTIDRRPLGATVSSAHGSQPVAVLALSAQLTPSEHEALQKAVSPTYLEERGLKEGSHGEIINERGRFVFEVGFASAIRKVLGN